MIGALDLSIIVVYLLIMLVIGLFAQRRASRGIDSYFLGNKEMPWWMLALSGGVSNFDITGTMWIVSLIYLIGVKSMWVHWMWGAYSLPVISMVFMGRWIRRANVMTQAEWIKKRYGEDGWGRAARFVSATMMILGAIFMLSYASKGVGKFFSLFLPLSEEYCALLIMGIVLVYVLLGGFYSVVWTDLIQTLLIWAVSIYLTVFAVLNSSFSAIEASTPVGWLSFAPEMRVEYLSETPYYLFGFIVIAWVAKGLTSSFAGPDSYSFQRYAAAKGPREASKMGAFWAISLIPRWFMATAVAALAIIGAVSISDPEMVLPSVVQHYMPAGLIGLAISGLLAAEMSTLDSTINAASAYAVKDLYQGFIRPKAGEHSLMRIGYISSILIVAVGLFIGLRAESIAQIWNWINLSWGAGILMPTILGWYWWRFNAKGYIFGVIGGAAVASIQAIFFPEAPLYVTFPLISGISLVASVMACLFSSPVDKNVLDEFYRLIRPKGLWRRFKKEFPGVDRDTSSGRDVINIIIGIVWVTVLYLTPVYLVFRDIVSGILALSVALALSIVLYFTWYRRIPEA